MGWVGLGGDFSRVKRESAGLRKEEEWKSVGREAARQAVVAQAQAQADWLREGKARQSEENNWAVVRACAA